MRRPRRKGKGKVRRGSKQKSPVFLPSKRREGRPTKLTPERAKIICQLIKFGSWLETAAVVSGIHRNTLLGWSKRGHDALERISKGQSVSAEEVAYADFFKDLAIARAQGELMELARINRAAKAGVWQAAAWKLERRYPERWRKRKKVEQASNGADPLDSRVESSRNFALAVIANLLTTAVS